MFLKFALNYKKLQTGKGSKMSDSSKDLIKSSNSSVSKYCNTKLENREGYLSSPGFPQWYPQLDQCGWTISSSTGQTILLKILHLHLRPATEVYPTVSDPDSLYALGILGQMVSEEDAKCDVDSLTIFEGNVKRASVCGESVFGLKTLEMESGEAEINFKSANFYPASGFLMYYKTLDDITTTTVAVQLNESTDPVQLENSTLPNPERTTAEAKKAGYIEDIIIPSVLIAVLLVVNAIIVATILIIRRRHKAKFVLEEEHFEDPKSEPLVADVKDV